MLAAPPTLSERGGGAKTYSYSLQASAPCSHLALAVGPFAALPDPRSDNVTHFGELCGAHKRRVCCTGAQTVKVS